MNGLPINVYSVASVREIDSSAIEQTGVPGYALMERAAAAAVREALASYPDARRWQIVCGSGNNAGDGYVVARIAASQGIVASVLSVADPESLTGDAATAYGDFKAEGGVVLPWTGVIDPDAELLVDALLGSGLTRDVDGDFAAAVAAINAAGAQVLALDIPTGLHGDTGRVLGCAVHADTTVTFVGLKQGQFLANGADHCGDIRFSDLDIDAECYTGRQVEFRRIASRRVDSLLPRRKRTSHKGDFGHVLVIGGGKGMPGAVRLCGEAALRAGAGRVSIATDPSHAAVIVASRPELMSHAIPGAADLDALLVDADVIAFGPGLGRSEWAGELVAALQKDDRPAVWDADALNWLAESPDRADHRIITPHPGEASTLLGVTTAEIQGDRPAALGQLQERYGGVAVLKGAGSLVSSSTGEPWLCTVGNPGMAAPGMGDLLTGIIAALLAQGLSTEDAALAGVELHARAGDRAAKRGERGLMASDLLAELRGVVNS